MSDYCIIRETYHHSCDNRYPISIEYGNYDYSDYLSDCGKEYKSQVSIDWLIGQPCYKCHKIIKLE